VCFLFESIESSRPFNGSDFVLELGILERVVHLFISAHGASDSLGLADEISSTIHD
jgi:hypothetical protein